jgi:DNA-binding NtrC family response regulator
MAYCDFRHRERTTYQDFVEEVEVVFASPQSAFFGGEHAVIDGGIAVVQHLDRYVWAGVRRIEGKEPRVQPLVWVPTLADLPSSMPDGYDLRQENLAQEQLARIILAACRRFGFRSGVEIHLLTEGFPASGANTSGAVAATVAAGLLWESKAMSEDEIAAIAKIPMQDLARTKADPAFQARLRKAKLDAIKGFTLNEKACFLIDLAWMIDAFAHGGRASGYGAVAGVVHSLFPFCFFPERRSPHPRLAFGPLGVLEQEALDCRPFDLRQGVEDLEDVERVFNAVADTISEISFCVFPLDEVVGEGAVFRNTGALPFTWGVVHSGCTKNTAQKISQVEDLPGRRWAAYQITREILQRGGAHEMVPAARSAFGFLEKVKGDRASVLRDPMRWEIMGLHTELLPAVCKAMEGLGTTDLAGCMRRNQGLLDALGLDWPEGRLVADAIYRAVPKGHYEATAVKLSGGGGGGCLMFVAPAGDGQMVEKGVYELRKQLPKVDLVVLEDGTRPEFEFGAGLTVNPELSHSKRRARKPTKVISIKAPTCRRFEGMLGESEKMTRVFELIPLAAAKKDTVLVTGESGTGKGMVARAIHVHSPRREKPFVAVNCGALAEALLESELFGHVKGAFTGAVAERAGRFKMANGGTVFLDEVETASPGLQVKLLKVLDQGEFEPVGSSQTQRADVRCIVATNQDLETEVREGRFRLDLYFRINVLRVDLPPLRERGDDIDHLAHHFLTGITAQYAEFGRPIKGFTQEALACLKGYAFPGNVREMECVLKRAASTACMKQVGSDVIELEDLPGEVKAHGPLLMSAGVTHTMSARGEGQAARVMADPAISQLVDGRITRQPARPPTWPASGGVAALTSQAAARKRNPVAETVLRRWAHDELTQLLCLVFVYCGPRAELSRGEIEKVMNTEGFQSFLRTEAPGQDLAARLGKSVTKMTDRKFGERVRQLCDLRWIEQIGKSRRDTKYRPGPQWPSENSSGNSSAG